MLWKLSPTVSNRRTMSGEQSVSVEAPSTGTGLGVPGTVKDKVMKSFQGGNEQLFTGSAKMKKKISAKMKKKILKGRSIIELETPEIQNQFRELEEKKEKIRSRFKSKMMRIKNTETKGDTTIDEDSVRSMLEEDAEYLCQVRKELDEAVSYTHLTLPTICSV